MKKKATHKGATIPESVGQHIEELYRKSPEFRKAYDEEVALLKLAYKIAQLRKLRHMTQRQLAKQAGMTQQNVSRLEDSQNTQLTIHTLVRLAKALHARLNVDLVPQ